MIRSCSDGDLETVFETFARIYPSNPRLREREYFEWQFKDNPRNETSGRTFLCAWSGSSLDGFIGYTPVRLLHEGAEYDACWVENWWATTGGAALRLLTEVYSRFDHRLMSGVSDQAADVYRKLRIPMLDVLPRFIALFDPERTADRLNISDAEIRRRLARKRVEISPRLPNTIESVSEFDFDPVAPEEIWGSVGCCRRTLADLTWRYVDIPSHNYQILRNAHGNYCVYRVEQITGFDDRIIRILEWCFDGEDALRALSVLQSSHSAIFADFFCTSKSVAKEMRRIGFIGSRDFGHPIPYLFRPTFLTTGIRVALDVPPHRKSRTVDYGGWYITKGDSDIDRIKL